MQVTGIKLNSTYMDASVQSGKRIIFNTQSGWIHSVPLKSQYFEKDAKIGMCFSLFLLTLKKKNHTTHQCNGKISELEHSFLTVS